MRVYALSDLHLSFQSDKPMNVFGERWDNYEEKIRANWNKIVTAEDVVVIAGDISWAMQIENTKKDFEYIDSLNGKKVIVRGNHDFWWKTISKVREIVPSSISVLQNDAIKVGNLIFCGTRGWLVPERGKPYTKKIKKTLVLQRARYPERRKTDGVFFKEKDCPSCGANFIPDEHNCCSFCGYSFRANNAKWVMKAMKTS